MHVWHAHGALHFLEFYLGCLDHKSKIQRKLEIELNFFSLVFVCDIPLLDIYTVCVW
jgi:hypothetical protein